MKESAIESRLAAAVKERQGLYFKLTGYKGMPDRLVLLPGNKCGFVELKRPGEEPRKDQLARASQIRQRGFKVFWIDSLELVQTVLDDIEEKWKI